MANQPSLLKRVKKLTCFLIAGLLITLSTFSQGKFMAEAPEISRAVKLTKVPDITVADNSGREYKLPEYLKLNQLHKGKPFIIAGFGFFGNYSIDQLNKWSSTGLGSKYNVVVLCVGAKDFEMKNTTLTKDRYEERWEKFLVVKTTWESAKAMYFDSWPFLIFTDKDQKIIKSVGNVLSYYTNGEAILDGIHSGKIGSSKQWFTDESVFTYKDDPKASYFEEYRLEGNKTYYTEGNKIKTLTKKSFINKGETWYYDGDFEVTNDKGQVFFSGSFKEGAVTSTATSKDGKGKVNWVMPVNGTMKVYNKNGEVEQEGPMVNGLANGLFTVYKDGIKIQELNYKNGDQSGIQKFYAYGLLEKEYFASPLYTDHGYFSEGLQKVKLKGGYNDEGVWGYVDRNGNIVIKPIYNYVTNFHAGLATVKVTSGFTGDYLSIDQQGKTIDKEEARRIIERYDAKNYNAREIVTKTINAMGGLDALKKIKTIKTEGYGQFQNQFNCNFKTIMQVGKGYWRSMEFEEGNLFQSITPGENWVKDLDGEVSGDNIDLVRLKQLQAYLSISELANALDKGIKIEFKGMEMMAVDMDGLAISFVKDGIKYSYTIHPVTYFIASERVSVLGNYEARSMDIKYDDYRKTSAGVTLPYHVNITDIGQYNLFITKMEINQDGDAKIFARHK
jgi:antitoxin component YwqK of YwqJK toxin-antitoxin module